MKFGDTIYDNNITVAELCKKLEAREGFRITAEQFIGHFTRRG